MKTHLGLAILTATTLLGPCWGQAGSEEGNRLYRFLIQQNHAQVVVLREGQLLTESQARAIAAALRDVDEANKHSGALSSNYLDLEAQLVAKLGSGASNLHMARSRNDLGATSERMMMREDALRLVESLSRARAELVVLAEKNIGTVIPGYTHAVQAQPTTLAHYLSAFVSSLERDEQRLREVYVRIDASPLGAAAFTTSGIRIDRHRLKELLGFRLLVENSYDAIAVSTVDSKAEFVNVLAISALNVGRFAQQFLLQYSDSRPGLGLADEAVGHSSIMPQKRNPRQAERIRLLASGVLGDAQTVMTTAQNTPGGEVADIRIHLASRVEQVARQADEMLAQLAGLAGAMRVDPERTLELVNADYSVMTELADTLLREAGVPFRVGHKVASDLAAYGRAHGKRPVDLTFEEAAEVYVKSTGAKIPLTPSQVRVALDPEEFVRGRRGIGGPQPDEVKRMLDQHRQRIDESKGWVEGEKRRLAVSERMLAEAYSRLLVEPEANLVKD
jgi:argininosuccinate lyase